MFICQLSNEERLRVYKAVKAYLLECGVYSLEEMRLALNSRVVDLPDVVRLAVML